MASVFFSYSHKDEDLRDQLEIHLTMLKRQGVIDTWHDRRITAGENIDKTIDENLEKAEIILILVSADFLASDYCYEKEMKRALERHEMKDAILIPIILRPCDWKSAPFGKLLAAPTDGKPVTKWPNIDEAFLDIVQAIKGALNKIQPQVSLSSNKSLPTQELSPLPAKSAIRSSNLRVAKEFSESSRDNFAHKAFEYIALFFENSITELSERNPEIEGAFRKIDANRFTAVIYRNGEAVSRCTIFLGGFFGSNTIGYNSSDNGDTNSYNQSLAVESDSQSLYLKPGTLFRNDIPEKLSYEGAAELLWSTLLGPLQR